MKYLTYHTIVMLNIPEERISQHLKLNHAPLNNINIIIPFHPEIIGTVISRHKGEINK